MSFCDSNPTCHCSPQAAELLPQAGPSELRPPQEGEQYGKGVVFYTRNDTVVGLVLWNVFNKMPIARKVRKYIGCMGHMRNNAPDVLFYLHSCETSLAVGQFEMENVYLPCF